MTEPTCKNCGTVLHRYRDLVLCQDCEDQLTVPQPDHSDQTSERS